MINITNKESNCASTIPPHLQGDHSDLTTNVMNQTFHFHDVMTLMTVLKPSALFRTKFL